MRRGPERSRRGSVYVLVLAAGAALTVLCVAGLALARTQRAGDELRHRASRARALSGSGLELASSMLASDPEGSGSWRKFATATLADMPVGSGNVRITLADPDDGNLADSIRGRVRVRSEARIGAARQILEETLRPAMQPMDCLLAGAWTGNGVTVTGTVRSTGMVGTNGAMSSSGGRVYAPAAGSTVSGWTYYGGTASGITPLALPSSGVISSWATRGTQISMATLGGRLRRCVLSPGSNPFGAVNPQGIYVINCAGSDLTVEECRVNGTLIVMNPGSGSQFGNAVFLEGRAGQPALLVSGSMRFNGIAGDALESTTGNLNPVGSPYDGVVDSDTADAYPSLMLGVVYVTGNVAADGAGTAVKGVLLAGGRLTVSGALRIIPVTPTVPIEGFERVSGFVAQGETLTRVVE
jgi:hypothetical protein